MKQIAVFFIRVYRAMLAPLFGPCCRFTPSCSHYAEEAFEKKGFIHGFFMTLKRLLKCQPFHPGGWDPVER